MLRTFFITGMLFACGTSHDEPEPAPCEVLRDHVVDLNLYDIAGNDKEQHRSAMKQALAGFAATCATKLSAEQITCALAAPTAELVKLCTSH